MEDFGSPFKFYHLTEVPASWGDLRHFHLQGLLSTLHRSREQQAQITLHPPCQGPASQSLEIEWCLGAPATGLEWATGSQPVLVPHSLAGGVSRRGVLREADWKTPRPQAGSVLSCHPTSVSGGSYPTRLPAPPSQARSAATLVGGREGSWDCGPYPNPNLRDPTTPLHPQGTLEELEVRRPGLWAYLASGGHPGSPPRKAQSVQGPWCSGAGPSQSWSWDGKGAGLRAEGSVLPMSLPPGSELEGRGRDTERR